MENRMKLILSLLIISIASFSYSVLAEDSDDFRWRDMRAACKGDHDSEACHEQREKARAYCAEHADKKRCRKMKALKECKHNPDSEICQEHKKKFKAYCKEHPGAKKCVRARVHKICMDDPESEECLSAKENAHAKFCERHPDSERCK